MMYITTKNALVILFHISLSYGKIESMTCALFWNNETIDFKKLSSVAYVKRMVEPGLFKIGMQKHLANQITGCSVGNDEMHSKSCHSLMQIAT